MNRRQEPELPAAARFRSLHVPGAPLVLANAWDAGSARVSEAAGAAAVGTTSAGIAWSLGVPDGNALRREDAIDVVRRIAACVDVPVTADVEGGYGADPDGVATTMGLVQAAGAVGVNLEDVWHDGPTALRTVADQTARIAAARAAGGPDLFINLRTDTYLRAVGAPEERLADTVARARAYLEAGADGIFVPGVVDASTIEALVRSIDAPLNVMVGPGALPVSELAALGVARISLGSSIASAAYGLVERAAREAFDAGTYDSSAAGLDYGRLNEMFAPRR